MSGLNETTEVESSGGAVDEFIAVIKTFVRDTLEPKSETVEATGVIPEEILSRMRSMGLFGLTIPEKYGGSGLSISEYCRVAMELGQTHQAYRTIININNGIGSHGILSHGTDEQKDRILPKLASGESIAAFALSEPEAGSDVKAITMRASLVDDNWVLSGTKQWITNGPIADVIVVIAKDEELGGEHTAFIVEDDPAGLVRGRPDEKMGFNASLTSQLTFSDVEVPRGAVLGNRGDGFKVAMSSVNTGRLAVTAGAIGAAKTALNLSINYAQSRTAFGGPIGHKQAIRHMLADMAVDIECAESLLLRVTKMVENGTAGPHHVAMAKLFSSEAACRVADSAVQIHGAVGYVKPHPVERIYRDVRLFRIVEGTSEIQRNLISRKLLDAS